MENHTLLSNASFVGASNPWAIYGLLWSNPTEYKKCKMATKSNSDHGFSLCPHKDLGWTRRQGRQCLFEAQWIKMNDGSK